MTWQKWFQKKPGIEINIFTFKDSRFLRSPKIPLHKCSHLCVSPFANLVHRLIRSNLRLLTPASILPLFLTDKILFYNILVLYLTKSWHFSFSLAVRYGHQLDSGQDTSVSAVHDFHEVSSNILLPRIWTWWLEFK
jgi:hypothetical protein